MNGKRAQKLKGRGSSWMGTFIKVLLSATLIVLVSVPVLTVVGAVVLAKICGAFLDGLLAQFV
jgi:hypothetical protein